MSTIGHHLYELMKQSGIDVNNISEEDATTFVQKMLEAKYTIESRQAQQVEIKAQHDALVKESRVDEIIKQLQEKTKVKRKRRSYNSINDLVKEKIEHAEAKMALGLSAINYEHIVEHLIADILITQYGLERTQYYNPELLDNEFIDGMRKNSHMSSPRSRISSLYKIEKNWRGSRLDAKVKEIVNNVISSNKTNLNPLIDNYSDNIASAINIERLFLEIIEDAFAAETQEVLVRELKKKLRDTVISAVQGKVNELSATIMNNAVSSNIELISLIAMAKESVQKPRKLEQIEKDINKMIQETQKELFGNEAD
jgi:hypothetical protein